MATIVLKSNPWVEGGFRINDLDWKMALPCLGAVYFLKMSMVATFFFVLAATSFWGDDHSDVKKTLYFVDVV